ncbi:hypothetical protein LIER_24534 [Lithospermum erythrorhizon]|uniref:Uncharacterized protein n=1 Tax=Lithospermum erythrorhizon TaxID=34254 RepID=A0AAV3R2K4_LITER
MNDVIHDVVVSFDDKKPERCSRKRKFEQFQDEGFFNCRNVAFERIIPSKKSRSQEMDSEDLNKIASSPRNKVGNSFHSQDNDYTNYVNDIVGIKTLTRLTIFFTLQVNAATALPSTNNHLLQHQSKETNKN